MRRHLGKAAISARHQSGTRFAGGISPTRKYHCSGRQLQNEFQSDEEIDAFLSKPSWSVKSLLPTEEQIQQSTDVTPRQLYHLLRLSALPQPANEEEESKMLRDLRAQLHFVKEIQKVNTDGVPPLRSIRDESSDARKENEITSETVKDALAQEEVIGVKYPRIRRKKHPPSAQSKEAEDWDVLGQAPQKVGKYFVVHSDEG